MLVVLVVWARVSPREASRHQKVFCLDRRQISGMHYETQPHVHQDDGCYRPCAPLLCFYPTPPYCAVQLALCVLKQVVKICWSLPVLCDHHSSVVIRQARLVRKVWSTSACGAESDDVYVVSKQEMGTG